MTEAEKELIRWAFTPYCKIEQEIKEQDIFEKEPELNMYDAFELMHTVDGNIK